MAANPQVRLSNIRSAVLARHALIDGNHNTALRLFNGYTEGCAGLVMDVYACSLVIFNLSDPPDELDPLIQLIQPWLLQTFPWIKAVVVKTRHAEDAARRRGVITFGIQPDNEINEFGVRYAIDLTLNQDASLYLDTRNLRAWMRRWMKGKRVLNTFAYTGSLGAAALSGSAARVVQLDLSAKFMSLAHKTYALNGYEVSSQDFLVGDFFRMVAHLKTAGALFDCVVLDPPFFSVTPGGRVDLAAENSRLINKIRPLIAHNGMMVVVNNALYVSGNQHLEMLKSLCDGGYLSLEEIISVPLDVTGYPETVREPTYPTDPAPFNHPTKIAVLRVQRKDQAA